MIKESDRHKGEERTINFGLFESSNYILNVNGCYVLWW
jgi:hypothetical protein